MAEAEAIFLDYLEPVAAGGVRAEQLEALLADVAAGRLAPGAALDRLRHFPTEDLDFAQLDHHRAAAPGSARGRVLRRARRWSRSWPSASAWPRRPRDFLGTRATRSRGGGAARAVPGGGVEPDRTHRAPPAPARPAAEPAGPVLVVSAGTSDLPVAEEAAVIADAFGIRVERLIDVGVAGLHRLLAASDQLRSARRGDRGGRHGGRAAQRRGRAWSPAPVIAVPTSVGYGASFGGLAALLGMLNSCAAGVTVVNIDNGFGAAMAAVRMLAKAPA